MKCAICSSNSSKEYMVSSGSRLLKCEGCGLVFLEEAPSKEEIPVLYPENYYKKTDKRLRAAERIFQDMLGFFEKRNIKKIKSNGKLLDVGCGDASFLNILSDMQEMELYGVETSNVGYNEAIKKSRFKIYNLPLLQCKFEGAFFDIVTLRHVLEHVVAPRELLTEIWRVLMPGGKLIIRLPNIDSVEAKIAGKKWFHLDLPRHIYHYSPKSLAFLLGDTGFKNVEIDHFSLEYKHVILYSFLDWMRCNNNFFRKLALIFLPFAVVFSYLLAILGKSGTIEVHAEK